MSQREIATAAGLGDDEMARLWSAFGLPHADPDAPVGFEQSVELFALFAVGRDLLGTETAVQLARLIGEMNARLADALVSTFIVSVGGPATYADPTLLSLAEANTSAATLIDPFVHAFGILLRHHLDIARRPVTVAAAPDPPPSYEVRTMAIGFADLSGSTALEGRLSFGELGGALTEFESRCADIVNRGGGRVVKLIGDEVMFTAPDIAGACNIACRLVEAVDADPVLPPLRAGVAAGEVLARYGDCFGPVVNLAARLTQIAAPGRVIAPSALAAEIEGDGGRYAVTPNGAVHLRGFDDDVATVAVSLR